MISHVRPCHNPLSDGREELTRMQRKQQARGGGVGGANAAESGAAADLSLIDFDSASNTTVCSEDQLAGKSGGQR